MGYEVRRVPPNWKHPQIESGGEDSKQPMYDEDFSEVWSAWLADFDRIRRGDLTEFEQKYSPRGLVDWLQDDGQPPDPSYYRPWSEEEATWFQLWETVSEGTPITPPFSSEEELMNHLVAVGDEWSLKRALDPSLFGLYPRDPRWSRKAAEAMISSESAPSMVVVNGGPEAGVYDAQTGFPDSLTHASGHSGDGEGEEKAL